MELSNTARIFKALGNEQRLKLFTMLYRMGREGQGTAEGTLQVDRSEVDEASCCAIRKAFSHVKEKLNLSPSTISHHFKELQNAGLITCERDGQAYLCQVNEEAVRQVRAFLE